MKVHELISLLQECDEDAEVLLAQQPSWPFEYSLEGITIRDDATQYDCEVCGHPVHAERDCAACVEEEGDSCSEGTKLEEGCASNDVFLLEGRQLRYASKDLWANPLR